MCRYDTPSCVCVIDKCVHTQYNVQHYTNDHTRACISSSIVWVIQIFESILVFSSNNLSQTLMFTLKHLLHSKTPSNTFYTPKHPETPSTRSNTPSNTLYTLKHLQCPTKHTQPPPLPHKAPPSTSTSTPKHLHLHLQAPPRDTSITRVTGRINCINI